MLATINTCVNIIGSLPAVPLTGANPHFTCPLKNGEMLCFNVQGEPDFVFNLISSEYINLNALFAKPADEESKSIDPNSTFVSEVGLVIRPKTGNKTIEIKISAFDHSIDLLDSHTVVRDSPITIKVQDGKATINVESSYNKVKDSMLYVETGYGFVMKVGFLKKHLDMFITDNSGFTINTHGLLGGHYYKL